MSQVLSHGSVIEDSLSEARKERSIRRSKDIRSWFMGLMRASIVLLLPMVGWTQDAPAAKQAFDAALRAFEDGFYERSAKELEAFTQAYPNSERVAEAVLLRARASLELTNAPQAIQLLTEHLDRAGALAEPYRYWLAQAQLRQGDFRAAADSFALLSRQFTNSVHLLEAGYGEALANFKAKEWAVAIQLLENPNGVFRRSARERSGDEMVVRGQLLLAEAYLDRRAYVEARQAANALEALALSPEHAWRQAYVLCRIGLAEREYSAALEQTTNLLAAARATGRASYMADSRTLLAQTLERLNRLDEAARVYEENLRENVPADRRREGLLNVIRLLLDQNLHREAAQKLESFFQQYPEDAASEVALLTYGELYLKQIMAVWPDELDLPPGQVPLELTNLLANAQVQFQRLLTNYATGEFAGLARLNEGWCYWMRGQVPASRQSFLLAAESIPFSPALATALFKCGDASFYLQDYTNALRHYQRVLDDFVEVSEVRHSLFDRSLYQMIRGYLALGNRADAVEALNQLLKEQPESGLADRAMLLIAQSLNQSGQPVQARTLLRNCMERYPDRPLLPEVQLALARSFIYERRWLDAMDQYGTWLQRWPTNALVPQAEFGRAWVTALAGQETNALRLFTNFVARFPRHELVPRAHFWIGDFHFRQKDFVNAQLAYQDATLLASDLGWQARMMAGRAAFAGERWPDARDNFKALLNDNNCPSNIVVEALFGLGDTLTRQGSNEEMPLQKYEEAIVVFLRIPQLYPQDTRVPEAWGRVGDCYFALASLEPEHYEAATNAYHQILLAPKAPLTARSQAEVRLGMAKERLARSRPSPEKLSLLQAAQDHYLNVAYGKNLDPDEAEPPDPFWIKEAGLSAARLAEEQSQWEEAIQLYQRLMAMIPALKNTLERRIERAREQAAL